MPDNEMSRRSEGREKEVSQETVTQHTKEQGKDLKEMRDTYSEIVEKVSKVSGNVSKQLAMHLQELDALEDELDIVRKLIDAQGGSNQELLDYANNLQSMYNIHANMYAEAYNAATEEEKVRANTLDTERKRYKLRKQEREDLREEIKDLKEKIDLEEDATRREELQAKLREKNKSLRTSEDNENPKSALASSVLGGTGSSLLSAIGKGIADANSEKQAETFAHFSDSMEKFGISMDNGFGKIANIADKIAVGVDAIRGPLNAYVKDAANFIASNRGSMNAALYQGGGTISDFYKAFSATSEGFLTGSGLLSQKTYLEQIRQIASQGISSGIETAALLSAVAQKTVPQFNATNSYIRRLVLLREKEATQRFFGLESIIQGSLNAQFGDSSYLNQLFDSVNSNLTDAITNLSNSILGNEYDFLSTTQTWLSYMYEQGVDQSTVQNISQAINALGSGNISGMGSNAGMQKLFLMSMDRANIDYASVLQNGLDASTVNALFSSMVDYLKSVSNTTSSNNVLENAYANLFGLSMTDMYALGQINKPTSVLATNEDIENEVQTRLTMLQSDAYTSFSEKIDNVVNNLQFSFGNEIANNAVQYGVWVGSNMAMDIGGAIRDLGGIINPAATVIGEGLYLAGAVGLTGDAISGVVDVAKNIVHSKSLLNGQNSVLDLYQAVTGESSTGATTQVSDFKSLLSSTTNADQSSLDAMKSYETERQTELEEGGDDETLSILKEFEKTMMKNKEGNMAIAVSLEGMSKEVLKSFASIFADEEAMTDVFKTKKSKNNLFDYGEEPTSSNPQQKGKNNSTTGSNGKS